MKVSTHLRLLAVLVSLLALVSTFHQPARASRASSPQVRANGSALLTTGLLYNGDIEDGCVREEQKYQEWDVAEGWNPWYIPGTRAEEEQGYFRRPEFQCVDAEIDEHFAMRVHDGRWSQKFFNSFATHVAGMWQPVAVPTGSWVTFSAWVQTWSSNGSDPYAVEEDGIYWVKIGIDPTGAVDTGEDGEMPGPEVIWSEAKQANNEWIELTVTTQAQSNIVTVWTWGGPVYRVAANNSYWDDMSVTVTGGVGTAGLRATPVSTPWAIATVAATPRPERDPVVRPTQSVSATDLPPVQAEPDSLARGQICIYAFADYNGDGLPGVRDVTLTDFAFSIDGVAHTTDGDDCLWVRPGAHLVQSEETVVLSTADVWNVQLQPSGRVFIAFGAKEGSASGFAAVPLWIWILLALLLGVFVAGYALRWRDRF